MEESMPDTYCVILTTAGNQEEANRLSELLVSRRLAACVQVSNIQSCYLWKGKIVNEPEHLLLIKTMAYLYHEVEKAIVENHSYEIPEIVLLPISQGLDRYLGWVEENTRQE